MAIIKGTNAANQLTGTGGADTIYGYDGDDRISALGGNDLLFGGEGSDRLDGGAGVDTASWASTAGGVRANLGTGRAVSMSDAGQVDVLVSVEGLVGSGAHDELYGNAGANTLRGGGGYDYVDGGRGNDLLDGGDVGDGLFGNDGDDVLRGGGGGDQMYGEAGRDRLFGGAGGDTFNYFSGLNSDDDPGTNGYFHFGSEVVMDFHKGEDKLQVALISTYDEFFEVVEFGDFDTNKNGVLDAGDQKVDVRSATVDGATRTSTFIDAPEFDGDDSTASMITVFGVTGLRATDFVSQADYDS